MAGSYVDAPGFQFQPDLDGSVGFLHSSGGIVVMSNANLKGWTDSLSGQPGGGYTYGGLVFPQLRDVTGFSVKFPFTNAYLVQTSPDTTNGLDGTWTTRVSGISGSEWSPFPTPGYRNQFRGPGGVSEASLPYNAIKSIRFSYTGWGGDTTWYGCRLYGNITAGEQVDRLRLWHPTLNQEIGYADLDFANTPRGGTYTKTFRVKNNSATLTANTILVSRELNLADGSPSLLTTLLLDLAGSGYAATQTITSLAAGAISGVLTLRHQPPSQTGAIGPFRQRLRAEAGSWT